MGNREQKYEWLTKHELKKTKWNELKPVSPLYLCIPRDERLNKRFQSYPNIPTIFPVNSVGIVTARDHFVIDFQKGPLQRRIEQFANPSLDDIFIAHAFNLKDTGAWKLKTARNIIVDEREKNKYYTQILYRPFDIRHLFYHDAVIERGRREVMLHMLQQNLSLIAMRQVALHEQYNHFLVSEHIVDNRTFASAKGIIYQFPLYLYRESDSGGSSRRTGVSRYQTMFVFEPAAAYSTRHPNINSDLLKSLSNAYKKPPSPEQIFHYIYAVLYSNAYREKYAEFLKTDFPRVPLTKDYRLFNKLAEKGEELVELHLIKSKKLVKPIAKCEGPGNLRVEKVTYDPNKTRVHINPEKWFEGIPLDIWKYYIGGYQVAGKWLKDRKGRTLSSEEGAHYCKVATAISETIKIQEGLDELFKEVEINLLEVAL